MLGIRASQYRHGDLRSTGLLVVDGKFRQWKIIGTGAGSNTMQHRRVDFSFGVRPGAEPLSEAKV